MKGATRRLRVVLEQYPEPTYLNGFPVDAASTFIFTALPEQLGLKLVPQKASVESLSSITLRAFAELARAAEQNALIDERNTDARRGKEWMSRYLVGADQSRWPRGYQMAWRRSLARRLRLFGA